MAPNPIRLAWMHNNEPVREATPREPVEESDEEWQAQCKAQMEATWAATPPTGNSVVHSWYHEFNHTAPETVRLAGESDADWRNRHWDAVIQRWRSRPPSNEAPD